MQRSSFNTTAGSNCPAYQAVVVKGRYIIQRRRREWCRQAVERGHWSGGWWAAGVVVHVAS